MQAKLIFCLAFVASSAFGSTIFGASTTVSTGTTYTVAVTNFTTTGGDMAGMVITANFTTGGPVSCTWTSLGACNSGGGEFNVTYPAANSTHPQVNNSNWTLTNTWASHTLSSITVNGIPGLIAFDRCMTGASTFNDTNPGGTTGTSCTTAGTVGSDIGFSVGSGNGGGTAGITGTVQYANALHLASSSIVNDWWGQFTLTFAGTAFTSGSNFTFRSDSDILTSAVADVSPVPEPQTLVGVGMALLAMATFRRRRV
ncbi:MAG: PEP-CTERM sorting domain-containing protein [Bryobacteraceae bacterium]